MPDEQELTAKRRSWKQFSIRAILLTTAATALILGPWMQGLRRQRQAIAQIVEAQDAEIVSEKRGLSRFLPDRITNLFPPDFFCSVTEVRLSYQTVDRKMVTPDDKQWAALTRSLDAFPYLESLSLHTLGLQDQDLAMLKPLGDRVQSLSINELFHGDLKSPSLRHLEGWEKLKTLSFLSGSIDGQGIESLSKIPNLSAVTIGSGTFEGSRLSELAKASSLERITFWQCRFDTNCLGSLKTLPNLKSLALINMEPEVIPGAYQIDSLGNRIPIGPTEFRFERSTNSGAMFPGTQPDPFPQKEYDRQLQELLPQVDVLEMQQS